MNAVLQSIISLNQFVDSMRDEIWMKHIFHVSNLSKAFIRYDIKSIADSKENESFDFYLYFKEIVSSVLTGRGCVNPAPLKQAIGKRSQAFAE